MTRFRLGIDIGGTFTDFVLVDEHARSMYLGKRLTTHHDYLEAILLGLDDIVRQAGIAHAEVDGVVHGSTLVTNTVIERKGAITALLTTRGARDVIEIGSELRYDIYDLGIERPEPLAPRHRRYEIDERLGADGGVIRPLDLSGLAGIVADMRAQGVAAVAICLLHSYANPAHEQALSAALGKLFPEVEQTLSSELVPEIREYERTSTAVVNAYVQPKVSSYLRDIRRQLGARGVAGSLYMMLSSGGLTSVEKAAAAPVQLIESGPAGGAIAACFFGRKAATLDLISFDMGGTTAKMCLINNGTPTRTHDFEAARVHRFKKGSGFPLRVPVIDMIEIGAGGGSIARIDNMGLIKVGPESAGSSPGPACYGLGGDHPTVTDADLHLGYLDPGFFLGGTMKLDKEAAAAAIARHIGAPLGMDTTRAAAGIQEIVNESMATATRLYVSERGRDIRNFTVLAFGGAGPVHAYRLAQILGLKQLICPYAAGAASALGFLVAPLAVEEVRSHVSPIDALDWTVLRGLYAEMEASARRSLHDLGVADAETEIHRSAELRFAGQGYEIEVPIPAGRLDQDSLPEITENFGKVYRELFNRIPGTQRIEGLSWRLRAASTRPELSFDLSGDEHHHAADARKGSRPVWFHHVRGFVPSTVYDRYLLRTGDEISGPAVVEERESTVVVGPGARLTVDAGLNLVVRLP